MKYILLILSIACGVAGTGYGVYILLIENNNLWSRTGEDFFVQLVAVLLLVVAFIALSWMPAFIEYNEDFK